MTIFESYTDLNPNNINHDCLFQVSFLYLIVVEQNLKIFLRTYCILLSVWQYLFMHHIIYNKYKFEFGIFIPFILTPLLL